MESIRLTDPRMGKEVLIENRVVVKEAKVETLKPLRQLEPFEVSLSSLGLDDYLIAERTFFLSGEVENIEEVHIKRKNGQDHLWVIKMNGVTFVTQNEKMVTDFEKPMKVVIGRTKDGIDLMLASECDGKVLLDTGSALFNKDKVANMVLKDGFVGVGFATILFVLALLSPLIFENPDLIFTQVKINCWLGFFVLGISVFGMGRKAKARLSSLNQKISDFFKRN